ncbi:MAG: hypothetical protein ACRDNL_28135, partial [Spirillospora sp.]
VRGPRDPARRGAHIGLIDSDPAALSAWLADRGVVVSPRRDVLRLSFHYFNNRDDVARLCTDLKEYRQLFGRKSR